MTENERLKIRLKVLRGEPLTPEESAMLGHAPMPDAYSEEVKKDESEHWESSITKAAAWIGVDRGDLSKHLKKHKIAAKSKLGYECVSLKASYRAEHPDKTEQRATGSSKERKEAAAAELLEIKVKQQKGLYVPVQEVCSFLLESGNKLNDEWRRFLDDFRAVGAAMPPEQFDEWSHHRIDAINAEIRRWFTQFAANEAAAEEKKGK